jgi:vacuolar-type H+-ATPase subunit I/STV1
VLKKSQEQHDRMLHQIARSFNTWAVKVRKLKAIYMVMNMFHNEGQNFIAECWMPYSELGTAQTVLNRASVCYLLLYSFHFGRDYCCNQYDAESTLFE